ncbi:MAG: hypothetical protein HDS69_08545 [Bacteroidales bacterium]|nr:hypothetical protein [Bacteroidales bacterium]
MNHQERGNIKYTVMRNIDESQPHSIFFISDYAYLGSPETIRKILHEATINGVLEKAGHGIYIKPKVSRFGNVPVPLEKIAKEIADRDKCEILPSGSTAANLTGLSTQVPMNLSYITTGSTRTINIGTRKIFFRHASPKNFAAKGRVVPLLIQGLREIGEENISRAEQDALRQFIDKHQDPYLQEDLQLAPAWIQRLIKKLIQL